MWKSLPGVVVVVVVVVVVFLNHRGRKIETAGSCECYDRGKTQSCIAMLSSVFPMTSEQGS